MDSRILRLPLALALPSASFEMRRLHCVFLALAVSVSVPAQTYNISTIAGGALPVNIPGTSAFLRNVSALAGVY